MDKQQFLEMLYHYLSPMTPQERAEIMHHYEAYFAYGTQHGRNEEEIVAELGNPLDLATQLLGTPYKRDPSYQGAIQSGGTRRGPLGQLGMALLLLFLNLIMVPLFLALWVLFLSLCVAALSFTLTPVLVFLDWSLHGSYFPATMWLSLAFTGIGILLFFAAASAFQGCKTKSQDYIYWSIENWKGGSHA